MEEFWKYRARDGAEFYTPEECRKHEEYLALWEAYNKDPIVADMMHEQVSLERLEDWISIHEDMVRKILARVT